MSPRRLSPSNTRIRRVSVTVPIAVPFTSHFSHSARTSSTFAGSTTHNIRSWDSLTITSNGSIPCSRSGILATSRSIPTLPLEAISAADEVRPAAPRSCSATISPRSSNSNEHSNSFFSSNGSPTCTVGRLPSSASPSSADASTDAPPIPSRPVRAPNSTSVFPGPAAALRTSFSRSPSPSAIAFTKQFCSYGSSKYTSPPTVGTPIELP